MDRWSLVSAGRLGMAGVLCTGALIGSACQREAATGANALVGPGAVAAEGETGSGAAAGGVTAQSGGLTPAELIKHGWSCRLTPTGSTACSPPGRGLPVVGAPEDRPPSYLLWVFDTATSELLGFAHFIRTDLYAGQTCAHTGAAYTHRPLLGYYECFNPAS